MRYQNSVLWLWLEIFFIPKSYQFENIIYSPVIFFGSYPILYLFMPEGT